MALDDWNCQAQTLLTLEVLHLHCSLWTCNFFYILLMLLTKRVHHCRMVAIRKLNVSKDSDTKNHLLYKKPDVSAASVAAFIRGRTV